MNEQLLNTLFSRRKQAATRLIICLAISGLLAVASRIPMLFVSLPASWISGGLSIAFIWAIGPMVILLFQAYSLQGLMEAVQLRSLLLLQSNSTGELQPVAAQSYGEELAPMWRKGLPLLIHLALIVVLAAPVVANAILFSSYLSFVRPDGHGNWRYPTKSLQILDAFVGTGGWSWFKPLAPSISGNLNDIPSSASAEEKEKYRRLQDEIPWALFPLQTWFYVAGIAISFRAMISAWRYAAGKKDFSMKLPQLYGGLRRTGWVATNGLKG